MVVSDIKSKPLKDINNVRPGKQFTANQGRILPGSYVAASFVFVRGVLEKGQI